MVTIVFIFRNLLKTFLKFNLKFESGKKNIKLDGNNLTFYKIKI